MNDPEPTRAKAEKIYGGYIDRDCRNMVNLEGHTRIAITREFTKGSPSRTVFKEAQDQIFVLLKMDGYYRYINSNYYKRYIASLK